MAHPFRHFVLITKHRHRVIANASHCGIFWHSLKHDLSKYGPREFWTSAKYYAGDFSPIVNERKANGFFSSVCQHHSKRNPHHWEYWCDWFKGNIVMRTMPWKFATEYVCDMLSASKIYNKKNFKQETAYLYFLDRSPYFHMTTATREYIRWCLERYKDLGFKGLKKKDTRAKYKELRALYPEFETKALPGAGELSF